VGNQLNYYPDGQGGYWTFDENWNFIGSFPGGQSFMYVDPRAQQNFNPMQNVPQQLDPMQQYLSQQQDREGDENEQAYLKGQLQ
jgi:hypothetical protein